MGIKVAETRDTEGGVVFSVLGPTGVKVPSVYVTEGYGSAPLFEHGLRGVHSYEMAMSEPQVAEPDGVIVVKDAVPEVARAENGAEVGCVGFDGGRLVLDDAAAAFLVVAHDVKAEGVGGGILDGFPVVSDGPDFAGGIPPVAEARGPNAAELLGVLGPPETVGVVAQVDEVVGFDRPNEFE